MLATLASTDDVDRLLAADHAWLYKHSTACGTCFAALEQVEEFLASHPDEAVGQVVVQSHRALSNAIAQRLGITHQSPQLFLLRNGAVAWVTSHWGITTAAMEQALAKVTA